MLSPRALSPARRSAPSRRHTTLSLVCLSFLVAFASLVVPAGAAPRQTTVSGCPTGAPPADLAVTTAVRGSAYRLYCSVFLRLPDTGGLSYWVGQLERGRLATADVAAEFIGSTEFVQRYGRLDDPAFLDLIYRNVMGRSADADGQRYWISMLRKPGFGRDDLILSFSESTEFQAMTGTSPLGLAAQRAGSGSISSFLPSGLTAREAADRELALGTHLPGQCTPNVFGGSVRWERPGWNLTWCIRTDPNWDPWITDAVYVHEAIHVRVSLLWLYRDRLSAAERAEVERVVGDDGLKEGNADYWAMRYVPRYEGAPQYRPYLFNNEIWDGLFARYPIGGPLPS